MEPRIVKHLHKIHAACRRWQDDSRKRMTWLLTGVVISGLLGLATPSAWSQVVVDGELVVTMAGRPIRNGRVVVRNGKIAAVGQAAEIDIPDGLQHLKARVVIPGLVDAHTTIGLTGVLNIDHDQDHVDHSKPIQPAIRAVDAYNADEELVGWVRSFGVTTVHTGHSPNELVSGQTMIVKTFGKTVDAAVLKPAVAIAVTIGEGARKSGTESPGTRGKMLSMLREKLIAAREYAAKQQRAKQNPSVEAPDRDLELETLVRVLRRDLRLIITAHRAQDIASALRLGREFRIPIWLDGASEAYLLTEEIKAAKVPVIIHPTMARATGERENLSFETAAKLADAGIPVAIQSGYEAYVPKTRVVLFEAALAAAHGLGRERALAAVTITPARILGIADRVGSLEVGKDGDLALYDGDPFEYTSHCIGTVINGQVVSRVKR